MKLTHAAAAAILAFCSTSAAYSADYSNSLHARSAYAGTPDIYARDAYAEPENDFDLYARDAYAEAEPEAEEDFDLYARDAEAEAEPEAGDDLDLYAREAEAEEDELLELHPRSAYLLGYEEGLKSKRGAPTTLSLTKDKLKPLGEDVSGIAGQSGPANLLRNFKKQGSALGQGVRDQSHSFGRKVKEDAQAFGGVFDKDKGAFGDGYKKDTTGRNHHSKRDVYGGYDDLYEY